MCFSPMIDFPKNNHSWWKINHDHKTNLDNFEIFFDAFNFGTLIGLINKLFAPLSHIQWQRVNKAFTCTLMGLNPKPFFEVLRSHIKVVVTLMRATPTYLGDWLSWNIMKIFHFCVEFYKKNLFWLKKMLHYTIM
jgi:hypothetical protein